MYLTKKILKGCNEYINLEKNDYGTMMDVALLVLDTGESFSLCEENKETALLLLEGSLSFYWDAKEQRASRKNVFDEEAWCLHVSAKTELKITAHEKSEIYIQKTLNTQIFDSKLYSPKDVQVQKAGANGELMACVRREIKTFFDYENAPYSNMVLGEVLNYPGKWSSYPPHHHPQPEVYFHRFDQLQGFGVSFANGEVYKSGHNGLTIITDGFHSQAAAPGYAMCYIWGIRHIDGKPWQKTRIDDKEHSWLWQSDANKYIFQEKKDR